MQEVQRNALEFRELRMMRAGLEPKSSDQRLQ